MVRLPIPPDLLKPENQRIGWLAATQTETGCRQLDSCSSFWHIVKTNAGPEISVIARLFPRRLDSLELRADLLFRS